MNKSFESGTTVVVPDPSIDDLWNHSFQGVVVTSGEFIALVKDAEDNHYDVEVDRLEVVDA